MLCTKTIRGASPQIMVIDARFARYRSPAFLKNKISLTASFVLSKLGDLGGNTFGIPLLVTNKKQATSSFFFIGDLGGNRTRVAGMKTRCTNRYTTRPNC